MKRYKVSVDNGEYVDSHEAILSLCVRECIENLIDGGKYSGIIDIPGCCYRFSVCPEQYFPEDMIDNIHRIAAELRTMVETLSEIDLVQFRQTIVTIRECSNVLTSAAKREHNRIELKDESSGLLCPYHEKNGSGYHHYLNPDCPVCERELDRLNDELCEYHSAE